MWAKQKHKEAIILAVDCSKSMAEKYPECARSHFEATKQCIEYIIRQKLFAQKNTQYLLVEFSDTGNGVDIRKIGGLRLPSLEVLKYVSDTMRPTLGDSVTTDVMDALNLTIDSVIEETSGQSFDSKTIALFTDFNEFQELDFNRFEDEISKRLRELSIQLFVICPFSERSFTDCKPTDSQLMAIRLMRHVKDNKLGECFDFDDIIDHFGLFQVSQPTASSMYSQLELGLNTNALKIPIVMYIKVVEPKRKSSKIAAQPSEWSKPGPATSSAANLNTMPPVARPTTSVAFVEAFSQSLAIAASAATSHQEPAVPQKPAVIRGYNYGQTFVPLSDEQLKLLKYDKLQKGIRILSFASISDFDLSQRPYEKCYHMFPDPRPKQYNHKFVFQALVEAMIESNKAAIVRYNYRNHTNPMIGCLLPILEDEKYFLVYHHLPFADDIRGHIFPSLNTKQFIPTEEQLNSIDSLIDSMDLMSADIDGDGNSGEALRANETADPSLQHWFECLYQKNVREDKDLPQMAEYLKSLVEAPELVIRRSESPLKQVIYVFNLGDTKDDVKEEAEEDSIKRRRLE